MNCKRLAFIALLLLTLSPGRLARAQELDTQRERQQTQAMFAHELVRRSSLGLQAERQPTTESYAFTALLLDAAARLADDDPTILRLMIEAAQWAEDRELVIEGTRRLVRKQPQDHVAKLRLIDHTIRRTHSAEDRLAAYERVLGPAGESLHEAVRSRLAYDGAVLARELGETERFTELLALAIELDGTNKQAAALAAAYHAGQRPDQPAEQLELLLNLLHADPVDPSTYIAIARHLMRHGAYEQAHRYINAGIGLLGTSNTQLDDTVFMIRVLATWAQGNGDVSLQALDSYQSTITRSERSRRLQALEQENQRKARFGEPYTPIDWNDPPFQDLVLDLPTSLEWLRAMIADATGRDAMADVAAAKVVDTLDEYIAQSRQSLAELRQAPPSGDLDPDMQQAQIATSQSDLSALLGEALLARLLFDVRVDEAPDLLESYLADDRVKEAARHRFQGWLALRQDRPEQAREHFQQAPDDPLSELGLALLEAEAGNRLPAVRLLADVWKSQPETQIGLFAKSELEQLLGRSAPALSEATREMSDIAAEGAGDDLLYLWSDPTKVVQLSLEPVENELEYMDRPLLRVTLRNASNHPLALGPEAPLSSRLMLAASLRLDGRPVQARFLPLIVDLHRHFRLEPRESLTVDVNVNRDQHLEFAWATPGMNMLLRYRGILNYAPSPRGTGQYVADPMGVEAYADEIIAFGVPGPYRDPVGLMLNLDKSWGVTRFRLLSVAIAMIGTPEERQADPVPAAERARVREGLLERFDSLSDLERAWLLVRSMGMTELPADSPLIEQAASAGGELTTLAYLATRARTLDDPVLARALESESAKLRALARARRAALLARAERSAAPADAAPPAGGDPMAPGK